MAKLARSRLALVLADKLESGMSSADLAQEIAAYLLVERRSGELDSLMRDIMQIRAERGTVEVLARTAHSLTDSVRADIETEIRSQFPAAKQVIVSEVHDPDVVGGVRLELANQQLDLSVRAKLNKFKQLTTA